MTMITSAMRRVLAGDESLRALDPNGARPRSSARVPRTVRARSPFALRGDAADLAAKCEVLKRSMAVAEEPTPYYREALPEGTLLPQVMRGFA